MTIFSKKRETLEEQKRAFNTSYPTLSDEQKIAILQVAKVDLEKPDEFLKNLDDTREVDTGVKRANAEIKELARYKIERITADLQDKF